MKRSIFKLLLGWKIKSRIYDFIIVVPFGYDGTMFFNVPSKMILLYEWLKYSITSIARNKEYEDVIDVLITYKKGNEPYREAKITIHRKEFEGNYSMFNIIRLVSLKMNDANTEYDNLISKQ